MPVPKLMFNMSFPIIVSMVIQALYNIVDSIFVAAISNQALSAVSLVFPVQLLLIAVATGTGTGISALLSLNLGKGNADGIHRTVQNSLFLSIISFIVIGLSGLAAAKVFVYSQTSIIEIAENSICYMQIVCGGSIFYFISITFERLLQATGRTALSMYMQLLGAAVNLILDPILIFGLLGFPELGVAGAAIATIAGQAASMFLGLILNTKSNREISLSMSGFHPDLKIISQIYRVGLPSIFIQIAGSFTTYVLNGILIQFATETIAVYSICSRLQNLFFMPVYGLGNCIIPIIAYNIGAVHPDRVKASIKCGIIASIAVTACGTVILTMFPAQLMSLFSAGEKMANIGIYALTIFCLSFPFAGCSTICNSIFQAIQKSSYSICLSSMKQLILQLPLAFLLAKSGSLDFIWWSFPITEAITAMITAWLLHHLYFK